MLNNANNANLLLKSDYFIWLSRYAQTNINENTHWTMFTNANMAAAVQANRHGLPLKTVCGGSRQFYEWVMFKNRQTMIMLIMSLRGVIAATSVQNQRNGPVLTFYSKFSQNCCLPTLKLTAFIFASIFITFESQVLPGTSMHTNGCGYCCEETNESQWREWTCSVLVNIFRMIEKKLLGHWASLWTMS